MFYLYISTKKKLSEYKTAVWIFTGRLKRHKKISKEWEVINNYIEETFEVMLAYIPDSEKKELKTLFYAEK